MNKVSFDVFASWVKAHFNNDKGATMVEYALMVALIAVVCIAAVSMLGGNAKDKFSQVGASIGG
jgi:pilus assembly protein Flp/PilA